MKILIVHSYYQIKGGEDFAFEQEMELIGRAEQVRALAFGNKPGMKGALQFFASIWNIRAARKLKKAIEEFRPDIVHCHNLHFGIGPLAIRVVKKMGIPVVLTLHNYRLLCPSGTLLVEGAVFTDSLRQSFPWKAVRKKAYRNSIPLTFWLATITWFHKVIGTWDEVDKFIVLTEFSRSLFERSLVLRGSEKLVIKPNFVERVNLPLVKDRDYYLFIGRLSAEKGIPTLLDAFSRANRKLVIAGEGPLRDLVEKAASAFPNIHYLGSLPKSEVLTTLAGADALIFPSVWFEGLPLTIIEAFACATPVIASNLGSMASIITDGYNGLHFEAGNADALTQRLDSWERTSVEDKNIYRQHALDTYNSNFTADKNQKMILDIYDRVSDRNHHSNQSL